MTGIAYDPDLRDIRFVLYEQLQVDRLSSIARYQEFNQELYDMVLDEAARLSRETLFPINSKGDRAGCTLSGGKVTTPLGYKEAWRTYREGGWVSPTAPVEYGGQNLPGAVGIAVGEMFSSAACAFMMYPGLTRAAADLLTHFGNDWMRTTVVPRLVAGEWSGTMCLTEPQAGSAVGDNRTQAEPLGDRRYLIHGTKIFISGGDQDLTANIIHLVLARTPGAPAGVKGLSLFLVPKVRFDPQSGALGEANDVVCSGIEHKMGINGNATAMLNFGDSGGCQGWLLGEEGDGITQMFHMMNEARIGVGLQGLAVGGAAYRFALNYARDRVQGTRIEDMRDAHAPRVAIVEHPDVKRMLLWMKAHVEGLRSLLYTTAMWHDLAANSTDPAEKEKYDQLVSLLTPICKSHGSDKGFDVAVQAVQVFGGYGYCGEYPVEQYVRDAKIFSIYEGTNGIQALDLLGRKVSMGGGILLLRYMGEINEILDGARGRQTLAIEIEAVEKARDLLGAVTFQLGSYNASGDRAYPVLQATPYLNLFGTVVLAVELLKQAALADRALEQGGASLSSPDASFYRNKVRTARFYIHNILPQARSLAKGIEAGDRSALEAEF